MIQRYNSLQPERSPAVKKTIEGFNGYLSLELFSYRQIGVCLSSKTNLRIVHYASGLSPCRGGETCVFQ